MTRRERCAAGRYERTGRARATVNALEEPDRRFGDHDRCCERREVPPSASQTEEEGDRKPNRKCDVHETQEIEDLRHDRKRTGPERDHRSQARGVGTMDVAAGST